MDQMKRYAVYYAPREGAFAFRANEWLGREPGNDRDLPQLVLPGIGDPRATSRQNHALRLSTARSARRFVRRKGWG